MTGKCIHIPSAGDTTFKSHLLEHGQATLVCEICGLMMYSEEEVKVKQEKEE